MTKVVERLRSTRVATALEVDAAWQRVRDVSLQLGRWGRLDVQMLVEEHERGRVLVRISRRLRVTPFFASAMGAARTIVVMLAFTRRRPVDGLGAGGGVIGLALRAAWHAAATIALADTVMTRVLVEAGAAPFGAPAVGAAERAVRSVRQRRCRWLCGGLGSAVHSPCRLIWRGRVASHSYRRLFVYAAPYRRGWAMIALATLATTGLSLAQPWPLKVLVDHVLGQHPLAGWGGAAWSLLPGTATPSGLLAWVVVAGLAIFAVNSAARDCDLRSAGPALAGAWSTPWRTTCSPGRSADRWPPTRRTRSATR